jgi:hypothetical protein
LNWRYIKNPSATYYCLETTEGDGFVVCKFFENQGRTEIDITELICESKEENIMRLLSGMCHELNVTSRTRLNMWLPKSDPKMTVLKKMGFELGLPETWLGYRDFSGKLAKVFSGSSFYYSLGDSDVF